MTLYDSIRLSIIKYEISDMPKNTSNSNRTRRALTTVSQCLNSAYEEVIKTMAAAL